MEVRKVCSHKPRRPSPQVYCVRTIEFVVQVAVRSDATSTLLLLYINKATTLFRNIVLAADADLAMAIMGRCIWREYGFRGRELRRVEAEVGDFGVRQMLIIVTKVPGGNHLPNGVCAVMLIPASLTDIAFAVELKKKSELTDHLPNFRGRPDLAGSGRRPLSMLFFSLKECAFMNSSIMGGSNEENGKSDHDAFVHSVHVLSHEVPSPTCPRSSGHSQTCNARHEYYGKQPYSCEHSSSCLQCPNLAVPIVHSPNAKNIESMC